MRSTFTYDLKRDDSECDQKVDQLQQRRDFEKTLIQDRETNYSENNEKWYAISIVWIKKWKAFVNGNKILPGPIDNYCLYENLIG